MPGGPRSQAADGELRDDARVTGLERHGRVDAGGRAPVVERRPDTGAAATSH
jgi:hypothetical protein